MPVVRAEIAQLRQVVTQPVSGTFHQVVALAPGERGEVHFEFDVFIQIMDPSTCGGGIRAAAPDRGRSPILV
jgi:hypothetical protein